MIEEIERVEESGNGPSDPLTRIRDAYTLAATDEAGGAEIEALIVRHFLETLAEVALAVASRRMGRQEQSQ